MNKNIEEVKVALELLGHVQNQDAVRYLRPLLKHGEENVRREVISTLGKIGGDEAIKLLSESLKDHNSQTRLAAIWALGNIGSKEALRMLKPLLRDPDLAEEVNRIISKVGKQ